jgi:hypothetical protein
MEGHGVTGGVTDMSHALLRLLCSIFFCSTAAAGRLAGNSNRGYIGYGAKQSCSEPWYVSLLPLLDFAMLFFPAGTGFMSYFFVTSGHHRRMEAVLDGATLGITGWDA